MIEIPKERRPTYLRNCRILAVLSTLTAALYMRWLFFSARPENHYLYAVLVAAEVFNVVQAAGFWMTISTQRWSEPRTPDFTLSDDIVDLFITVYDEPLSVVEHTLASATRVRHPRAQVWVLDDGDSPEMAGLAYRYSVGYITRDDRRGAKAGNLNHALSLTQGQVFAVFDADQAPHPEFLEATLGAFVDHKVAFVQTPQAYRNRSTNRVAAGAHDQQALFYGPILRGKDGVGAVFSCGTNVVYRRSAISAIGGFPEDSITEDLRASLLLLDRGFKSVYVSKVLADGLGPLDVGGYFDQQLRWGRGGLEILFKRRAYSRQMSFSQRLQYSLGFLYWFTGWAYLGYLVMPVSFLLGALRPIQVPNDYPTHFLPYAFSALATIIYSSGFDIRFDALWFTLASFPVHVKALFTTFFGRPARFVVTPKSARRASMRPVLTLIVAVTLLVFSAVYGVLRAGPDPSVVNNVAWVIAHLTILTGFIRYALSPRRVTDLAEDPGQADRAGLELSDERGSAIAGAAGTDAQAAGSSPPVPEWSDR
jgi:cellulose synthase (UDP-forming)